MLATLGALSLLALGDDEQHKGCKDEAEGDDKAYNLGVAMILEGVCDTLKLATREQGVYRPKSLNHTTIVVARAEVGEHILTLQLHAASIAQHALDAISRHEAYLVHILDKQYAQAVVCLLISHAPPLEELHGKREGVLGLDATHRHDSHLGDASCAQGEGYGVERGDSRRAEDAIGVCCKTFTVAALHILDIRGAVALSLDSGD